MQNRRRGNGILERRETLGVQVGGLHAALVDGAAAIDKLFNGHVSVAGLAVEVAVLIGGVAHVERVEPLDLAGFVVGNVVAAVCLVDADLAIGSQVVEVLVGVDASTLRRRPGRGVDANSALGGVVLLGPRHQHGDCVLSLVDAAAGNGDALGGGGGDLDGEVAVLDHGVANVDVVAVEVVGNVRLPAGPGLEGVELVLGLGHVAVPIVEVAQLLGLEAGVRVGRVEALVVLDEDVDALCLGPLDELLVVLEQLDGGLGDEDVDAALDGVEGNGEMGRVRGEDCDGVAGLERVNGRLVGVGVLLVVGGEGVERGVEAVVGFGNVLLQMLACGGDMLARAGIHD